MSSAPGDTEKLLELDDPADADLDDGAAKAVPHPTVIPKFDPREYAEASETRDRMPTVTDEALLEQARLRSFPTGAPPPRRPLSSLPGPRTNPPDSTVEIDVGEDDIETLSDDEQVAILRAQLMPLSRVPALARPLADLAATPADPKTAYVIGFIDGLLPLGTIVDVTGLPELDTLRVLYRLIAQGVVVFRPRLRRR